MSIHSPMAGVAGAICSLSRADAPIGAGRARDRPPLVRPPGYAPVPATTAFPVIAELVGDERWRERLQELAPPRPVWPSRPRGTWTACRSAPGRASASSRPGRGRRCWRVRRCSRCATRELHRFWRSRRSPTPAVAPDAVCALHARHLGPSNGLPRVSWGRSSRTGNVCWTCRCGSS